MGDGKQKNRGKGGIVQHGGDDVLKKITMNSD